MPLEVYLNGKVVLNSFVLKTVGFSKKINLSDYQNTNSMLAFIKKRKYFLMLLKKYLAPLKSYICELY